MFAWAEKGALASWLSMAMRCAERSGMFTMLWQHEFYMVMNWKKERGICFIRSMMKLTGTLHCSGSAQS